MGITSSKDPKTEDIESNPGKDQVPSPISGPLKMGITSSKDPKTENNESNLRKDQVPSKKLEDWLIDLPISWEHPVHKAALILVMKEMDALFPSELEDQEDQVKRVMELTEQVTESLKGGDCKELVVSSMEDCFNKSRSVTRECMGTVDKLAECFNSHPNYYKPYTTVIDKVEELLEKHGYS